MIVSRITGGIGNQMFQYATGRALAERCDCDLRLDIREYMRRSCHNGFELSDVFGLPVHVATREDLKLTLGIWKWPLFSRYLHRRELSLVRKNTICVETLSEKEDVLADLMPPAYLCGYWQSEKYFNNIASLIRRDFTFVAPFAAANEKLSADMLYMNSISVHVRRGDYVSSPQAFRIHGDCCPVSYYKDAARYIRRNVCDPIFFVFSDDIEWVKANLEFGPSTVFVDHNKGKESYNDMRLMSLCKHHIIANSSFSWWGAWLNDSDSKIVIAPRKWFAHRNDKVGITPESWIRL